MEKVVEWGQEKESRLALSASLALSSSPKGGALGKNGNFAWIAKASHFGRGGIALAMTERARTLTQCHHT